MVRKCIICKTEWSPFNLDRSFYRFPSDIDLKNKWLHALGLSSAAKTATVCHKHFDEKSFRHSDAFTIRKRLLPNAVPQSGLKEQNISLIQNNDIMTVQNDDMQNNDTVQNDDMVQNDDTMQNNDIMQNDSMSQNDDKVIDDISNRSNKRKYSCEDYSNKKIRFFTNYTTEWISRKDFVSNDCWKRFLRFYNYHKRLINNNHQKICTRRKQIIKKEQEYKELQKKANG